MDVNMIKKIALNLLVLLYTSQLIAGPHYSDAFNNNDDGGGGSSSDFGLWVVGIIFLFFFIIGDNNFKKGFIKLCVVVVLVIAYTYLLFWVGKYFQESIYPTKNSDGNGIIRLLILALGWFGPLYLYNKKRDP